MARCKYCTIIRERDKTYQVHKTSKDLESDFPRCAWHWQFMCDTCGRSFPFHAVAWCDRTRKFLCIKCAPRHKKAEKRFWAWDYYYALWCDTCKRYHPAMDFLEYKGIHPWQKSATARRKHLGLNPESVIKPGIVVRWASGRFARPSQAEVQRRWDLGAKVWDKGYTKYGDSYRRHLFNPGLFSLIRNVKGKKVLDAGCGQGYMARLLAERGANVVGVDLSKKFIEIARHYESKKPLGIKYMQANLAHVPQLKSRCFDLIVSVYVLCDVRDYDRAIREMARVLKSRGRFVFLIEHPCFNWQSGGWKRVPADSLRTEDSLYLMVKDYFRRGIQESQWGKLPLLLTFIRPLSDYFHALKNHGFVVQDLIEPRPRASALRNRPADWEEENRVPPVLIIEAVKL
ncbi:methyltransferase domain-containing protein [candidate division WOR-3 bacterium]|nr:methyltransferase domain-containing protein [candidate division WOR-3 bacterium]